MPAPTCAISLPAASSYGMSRNSLSRPIREWPPPAASKSCSKESGKISAAPKMRPKLKRSVLVLVLLPFFMAPAPAAVSDMLRLESSRDAMGSTYSVILYGMDRMRLEAAAEHAFDEVHRLDNELSNYKPESPWSLVNRFAAERPVETPVELFELLQACLEYSGKSDGAFDITVGPLMKVWGFYKGSGHLPHPGEVKSAMAEVGYRNILLDPVAHTVRFARKGVELDPGGIAKGYAVDRMVQVLRRNGIEMG